MKLRVVRFDSGASFLAEVEPFLAEDEAFNSLMLGVTRSFSTRLRPRRRHQLVMAAVEDAGAFVAAAVMTSPHKLLLASHIAVPEAAVAALAADLRLSHPQLPAVFGPAALSSAFARTWTVQTGAGHQPGVRQKLHRLTELTLPTQWPDGAFRSAEEADEDQLSRWLQAFQAEALPDETADLDTARLIMSRRIAEQNVFVWETESHQPVSMAARARPTANGIAINLVYTPYPLRRQGYATACVARLSEMLVEAGRQPVTLFTDRANATANHIYHSLGYRPIGDFDEYRFTQRTTPAGRDSLAGGR